MVYVNDLVVYVVSPLANRNPLSFLKPAPYPQAVLFVLALEGFFQLHLVGRDHSPVEVGNCEGQAQSVPITLKLTEDTKMVHDTIGRLAGINVLFDPDYTSRRLSWELNGVTLPQALDLVAAKSKSFWKPMTSNTIFVAADNPAKRKELEENVVKTFYLSNLTAPTELQDIVNMLRAILDVNLELLNVSNGDFLSQGNQIVALVHREDRSRGTVDITASRPRNSGGVSGHGIVTTLTFQAMSAGQFPVKVARGATVQPDQHIKTASGSEIRVVVQ